MEITCRFRGGLTILDLTGRFVVSRGETQILPLRVTIRELIAEGRILVALNVAKLASIDARGLGELVLAFTTLRDRGGALTLIAPTPTLRTLLSVTRLDTVLPCCQSEGEATRAISRVVSSCGNGVVSSCGSGSVAYDFKPVAESAASQAL